jgi:DNA-directed RNA polymerase specialized sigma24 family protein
VILIPKELDFGEVVQHKIGVLIMDAHSIAELSVLCQEESDRFWRYQAEDRGYCFELFRRAVVDSDQSAWEAVFKQYRREIARWVNGPEEEVEERVNEAFTKFFRSVDGGNFTARFANIGKVMSYLKTCSWSVRIDAYRQEEKQGLINELEGSLDSGEYETSAQALRNILHDDLFAAIDVRLKDDQERLVFHLSFRIGLKPRHIADECPDRFKDVDEVRRIKERIVLRLSRDSGLQSWWNDEV